MIGIAGTQKGTLSYKGTRGNSIYAYISKINLLLTHAHVEYKEQAAEGKFACNQAWYSVGQCTHWTAAW